jgi:enhancing lycopene biosynthesis protein 2
MRPKKIALVLCGSGYLDGSEIRESVAALWALSEEGCEVEIFAPNEPQRDVVNCLTGAVAPNEARNQLVEAARIARGNVRPLEQLDPGSFDGLILPGGFGAAKSLSSFAAQGSKGSVHSHLKEIINKFYTLKKPIGAICVAPALLALALPGRKLELTLGESGDAAAEIEKLGQRHIVQGPSEAHVDRANRVVSTPAYMYDGARLSDVFQGIQKLVREVCALA